MATVKEREKENKKLEIKLSQIPKESYEYGRMLTRLNFNKAQIAKEKNATTTNKTPNKIAKTGGVSTVNTANVQAQDLGQSTTSLAKTGIGIAGDIINNNKFSQGFNPILSARANSGDLLKDRQRIEDEVFNRLTRGVAEAKDRERDQLSQTLYNRGIPLGSALYTQQMEEFDKKYNNATLDARAQATAMGGDEWARSFGIGEQTRSNELAEQGTIHNQNIGDAERWSSFPVSVWGAVQGVKQGQQAVNQAKRPTGGGGGNSGSRSPQPPAQAPSPFNNTLPPSYGK